MLGSNVVVKEHAETHNSVIGTNTYIGASARVRGTIIGRNCDIKPGATFGEGAAVGDECIIGKQAFIAPGIKVYPYKAVDSGAQIHSSIIWESRGTSRLFGRDGVTGLINVDITAELAVKLAMAYGTVLPKGAAVTTSRDVHPASRIIKRALICGLNSTGVDVHDLRVASSAINRFQTRSGATAGGMHVRISSWDPETIQIQVFEPPGINIGESRQKAIEKYYGREDFRRAFYSELGEIKYPDHATERYARALTNAWDTARIRSRGFRLVIDCSHSPASLTLPTILDELGVEVLSLRTDSDQSHTSLSDAELAANIEGVSQLVRTMKADLGLVLGPVAERLYIVDDSGAQVPLEAALLLLVRLVAEQATVGERIVLPITVTHLAERLTAGSPIEIVRSKESIPALSLASTGDGVVFAGDTLGGYIFPQFFPAFDAIMSLGKVLELLTLREDPLSTLVGEIPDSTLIHRTVNCPWALKGTVMRTAAEEVQRAVEGGDAVVSLIDGVKVNWGESWALLLPDADEPVFHVYAEGADRAESGSLADTFVEMVRATTGEDR